jgi:hypothetical protein
MEPQPRGDEGGLLVTNYSPVLVRIPAESEFGIRLARPDVDPRVAMPTPPGPGRLVGELWFRPVSVGVGYLTTVRRVVLLLPDLWSLLLLLLLIDFHSILARRDLLRFLGPSLRRVFSSSLAWAGLRVLRFRLQVPWSLHAVKAAVGALTRGCNSRGGLGESVTSITWASGRPR